MNLRENTKAILHYGSFTKMPVVHFGFWDETLLRWADEGHITREEAEGWGDGNNYDRSISRKLGFDYNYSGNFSTLNQLFPAFKEEVLERRDDGSYVVRDSGGAIVMKKEGVISIPVELDHTLVDRASWEEHFLPRLQFSDDRIDTAALERLASEDSTRDIPMGLFTGSLYGKIRDWMGIVGLSYLMVDDEELYAEIIDTVGALALRCAEAALKVYSGFDHLHFWEDICFKNGPLVRPEVFAELVGPHYRRITDLARGYGIDIASLDCDGCIDELVPVWLENGVNTMFPIEVGVWNASIAPWREKYGRELRGVGGMDKRVFAEDFAAVDAEIERLRPLMALGGYIPCPDHRIAPDAKFENVQYYCDKMQRIII